MYGDKVLSEDQMTGKNKNYSITEDLIKMLQTNVLCRLMCIVLLSAGDRIRGWFPRRCVEKCHYDTASSESTSDKKVN